MANRQLPFAHGGPPLRGQLRCRPEDFRVDEIESFPADGQGEHVWLRVSKREANTDWVASELARFCEVRSMDVGYAGLKDRQAITTQAFTVHLPGRDAPDWRQFEKAHVGIEILESARHRRKLKRGALNGNRFCIRLRDCQGSRDRAENLLRCIQQQGVPNYFGEQRFGMDGANVARAEQMFSNPRQMRRMSRSKRSILLSAARSQLFNAVLAERVEKGNWNQGINGEVWCLAGSRSWFGPEPQSQALLDRLAGADIHPSAPLWGRGPLLTDADARALESAVLEGFEVIRQGLERAGLDQERRATRLFPQALSWAWLSNAALELTFTLPPGCYATTVLRELSA